MTARVIRDSDGDEILMPEDAEDREVSPDVELFELDPEVTDAWPSGRSEDD